MSQAVAAHPTDAVEQSLASLSVDVLGHIASFLPVTDVMHITHLCQSLHAAAVNVWASKFLALVKGARHPAERDLSLQDWQRATIQTARASVGVPAAQHSIAWGDTPQYWTRQEPDADSPFRAVASLRAVCWLEIVGSATVHGRGTYDVVMRARFDTLQCGNLTRQLSVVDAPGIGSEGVDIEAAPGEALDTAAARPAHRHQWCYVNLGRVVVRRDTPVQVRWKVCDLTGRWKSGLRLDYTFLCRAEETPTVTGAADFHAQQLVPCSHGAPRTGVDLGVARQQREGSGTAAAAQEAQTGGAGAGAAQGGAGGAGGAGAGTGTGGRGWIRGMTWGRLGRGNPG